MFALNGSRPLFAVLAAAAVALSCASNKGSFTLVNDAGEPIALASVRVCGQLIELRGVPVGQRVEGRYRVRSDSHYTIEIEFQSGRRLREEAGYVTNGLDFHHLVRVKTEGIEVMQQ